MTKDGLKNLQISYNFLNLPSVVNQSSAEIAKYSWFADGSKYSVLDNSNNGYCYIGSLIYASNNGNLQIESTDFAGGRINFAENTSTNTLLQDIHYFHTDHLGSVRAITDNSGSVIEQNAYYPFGSRHTFGNTYAQTTNRFKFNGKEEQTTGNLNYLDYGARMYDSNIARWTTQDPLAEKYYSQSPYNYCVNNPVMFVDPDGRSTGVYYDRYGNFLGYDGIDDSKVYLLNEISTYRPTEVNVGKPLSEYEIENLKNNSMEVNGLIIQYRIEEGGDYTISTFRTEGGIGYVSGFMLEPAGPSSKIPNQDLRIPEGVYNIASYSSEQYPDHFILYNNDVPKSRGILYHTGNSGKDTEGCNIPGTFKNSNGTISYSWDKFKELRNYLKATGVNEVKTIINNHIK